MPFPLAGAPDASSSRPRPVVAPRASLCRRSKLLTTCPRFFCVSRPCSFICLNTLPQPSRPFISAIWSGVSRVGPVCASNRARAIFCSPGGSCPNALVPVVCAHAPTDTRTRATITPIMTLLIDVLLFRAYSPPSPSLSGIYPTFFPPILRTLDRYSRRCTKSLASWPVDEKNSCYGSHLVASYPGDRQADPCVRRLTLLHADSVSLRGLALEQVRHVGDDRVLAEEKCPLMRRAVWLCRKCCHRRRGRNSGRTIVTICSSPRAWIWSM